MTLSTIYDSFQSISPHSCIKAKNWLKTERNIISNESLFHSSHSHINLCWLLEADGLTRLLCGGFQRLPNEEPRLAPLPGERILRLPEDGGGRLHVNVCQRRREKIYLAKEQKNQPVPARTLTAPGGFIRGPMIKTHVDPEPAADHSPGLRTQFYSQ